MSTSPVLPDKPKVAKFSQEDIKEIFSHIFCMRYKKNGMDGFKLFYHEGNRASAIQRAQNHCSVSQRKHLLTTHALRDIDLEEAKAEEGQGVDLG